VTDSLNHFSFFIHLNPATCISNLRETQDGLRCQGIEIADGKLLATCVSNLRETKDGLRCQGI